MKHIMIYTLAATNHLTTKEITDVIEAYTHNRLKYLNLLVSWTERKACTARVGIESDAVNKAIDRNRAIVMAYTSELHTLRTMLSHK